MDGAHETTKTGGKNRFVRSAVRKKKPLYRTVFGNGGVDDGKIRAYDRPTEPLLDTRNDNRMGISTLLCAEREGTAGNVGR